MKRDRIVIRKENTLQVFRIGKTANKKIAGTNEKIMQTYTFSKDQFNYVKDHLANGSKPIFKEFFTLDKANCSDCIFSGNMRANDSSLTVGCYTHKLFQYSGFISMIKSIVKEYKNFNDLPELNLNLYREIQSNAIGLFVRFGSYGEPSMHDIRLVSGIVKASKNHTGYTHQYFRKPEYNKYFLASVHNQKQAEIAKSKFNFRSFIAHDKKENVNGVICPASNESDFLTNCSKCGLCSGNLGKGLKDIKILLH